MALETTGNIPMGAPTRQTSCEPADGGRTNGDTGLDRRRPVGGFTSFLIDDILKPESSCRAGHTNSNTISSPSTTYAATTTIKRDVDYTIATPPIDLTCKNRRRRRDESESDCSESSSSSSSSSSCTREKSEGPPGDFMWPAWVYCTRYSDRPSAGPRCRKTRREKKTSDAKRLRTAFSSEQLARLQAVFDSNRYLNEADRRTLAAQLALNESQIKIWFQNKRAKLKKASGRQNDLALKLMAEGLYNHASSAARCLAKTTLESTTVSDDLSRTKSREVKL